MQSTCRSDVLHGLYVSEGWRSVGFSRLLEALAAREEQCKQVGQERNAQPSASEADNCRFVGSLPPSSHALEHRTTSP